MSDARRWIGRLLLIAICPACGGVSPAPDVALDGGADSRVDGASEAGTETAPPFCTTPLPDGGFGGDGCGVPRPEPPDLLDEALALLTLERCGAVYTAADKTFLPAEIWQDPYRLPFFDPVHDVALRAPPFTRRVAEALDAAAASDRPVTAALVVASHHGGFGGEVCLPLDPASSAEPLAEAMVRLIRGAGEAPDEGALRQAAAVVPLALQRALAPVLDAIGAAAGERDRAFREADLGKTANSPGIDLDTLYTYATSLALRAKSGKALNPKEAWVRRLLEGGAQGVQYGTLYQAAIRLAAAVEGAGLSAFAGTEVRFNVDTPLGRVILGGPGDDTYDAADGAIGSAIALLLDTGGDDTYRIPAGATASAKNPVSVLVDLVGRDRYGYTPVPSPDDGTRLSADADGRAAPQPLTKGDGPVSLSEISRQGAGRLGIGLLWDLGPDDDQYQSLRLSQGFGALGVGVLFDAGGDDTYRGEAGVQGSGIFGIGLLLDGGGQDTYLTYHQSQGFAYVKGIGVLHDAGGDDAYLADVGDPAQGGDPLYFSPQLPGQGNSSFCQGAGFGRRADTTDQVFMSGGLGVLRDRAGNDRYRASVFAQGTGYWFGTGLLADGGGEDTYDGLWYVQGSDAHFALAVFLDEAGNDVYNGELVPRNTAIGVGHDFSVGWHLDLGGDDSYRAPGLSLGSGNDNGIGILVNLGGRDSYETKGKSTLGAAALGAVHLAGPRAGVLTLGVFVDAGGQDHYQLDGAIVARQGTSWLYTPSHATPTRQLGVGLDGEGSVTLP